MRDERFSWWRAVTRMGLGLAFVLLFLDSVRTAVHWWRGELSAPTVIDWTEIALLPVLLFVYLRYFSVLRPNCPACESVAEQPPSGHRRP